MLKQTYRPMTDYVLPAILDDWIWEISCEYPKYTLGNVINIFHFNSQKNDFVGSIPNDCIFCPEQVIYGDHDIIINARNKFLLQKTPIRLHFIMGRFIFNDSL
jgi:hypothetical protein